VQGERAADGVGLPGEVDEEVEAGLVTERELGQVDFDAVVAVDQRQELPPHLVHGRAVEPADEADPGRTAAVGLAAPQVGKSIRLAVVDVTTGKNPEAKIVMVNPEIIHLEGEVREEEGCLSIPGFRGYVIRPQFVTVRAQNAKGETFEMRGENLLARAFCHELDHLNGVLFLQHLSMLKRDLIRRKIKKLRKQGEW